VGPCHPHSVYHSSNESCTLNRPCNLIRSSIFVVNNVVTFSLLNSKDPLSYEVRGRALLTANKVCNKYTILFKCRTMFNYYAEINIYIADASFPSDNEDGAID
jgi:hypothetical protein